MALLELRDVNTYYGSIHALKNVSLKVEAGQIVTLIGSNGAGKTTTCAPSPACARAAARSPSTAARFTTRPPGSCTWASPNLLKGG